MPMVSRYSFAILVILSLMTGLSCSKHVEIRQDRQVTDLLAEAERLTSQSRYDEAVGLAFDALKKSEAMRGDRLMQAKAHLTLSK